MRQIELHPAWINAPTETVIGEIGSDALHALMEATVNHYNAELPLWRVMNWDGIDDVGPGVDTAYVPCRLLSHNTIDKKASAQYYTVDRETGESKPAFWCHKCQKLRSSFWYLRDQLRDYHQITAYRDIYRFIFARFGVSPPLDLWFNFDSDKHFADFGSASVGPDPKVYLKGADAVRALKATDPAEYLRRLSDVLYSRASGAAVQ